MLKVSKRNWIVAFVCAALMGKAESGNVERSIESFERTVRRNVSLHQSPVSDLDILAGLFRTKLSTYDTVKAAQRKYGLTDDEVKGCLKGMLFSSSAENQGVAKYGLAEVLIHDEFVDADLRKYLEDGIRLSETPDGFVRLYFRLTGNLVEAGVIHEVLNDKDRYKASCRRSVYQGLAHAYRNSKGRERSRIGHDLREGLLREVSNLETERRRDEASSCKGIVCSLDAFLRRNVKWAFSSQRLSVLERAVSVTTVPDVSKWASYLKLNIALMKYRWPVIVAMCLLSVAGSMLLCFRTRALRRVAGLLHRLRNWDEIVSMIKSEVRHAAGLRTGDKPPCGIGRARLCLWLVVSGCFARLIVYAFKQGTILYKSGTWSLGEYSMLKNGLYGAAILLVIWVLVQLARRLQNIGYPRVAVAFLAIPFMGIVVLHWCLACQEGYAKKKSLDSWGSAIATVNICAVICMIAKVYLKLSGRDLSL